MSSFEVAFLTTTAVLTVLLTSRKLYRRHRINRSALRTEPGAIMTSPIHGSWTPGRPGQGARLYTGQAVAHGTNAYGDGSKRY
jgi:hypothetical protein